MSAQPPGRISVLWCPVCGRDDRFRDLKRGTGRHYAWGAKCQGTPVEVEYAPVMPPAPTPAPLGGGIAAAVAVEVAVRPALHHLEGDSISFVSRSVLLRADTVEQVAELSAHVLRDIAIGLPDSIAAHPRPDPERTSP